MRRRVHEQFGRLLDRWSVIIARRAAWILMVAAVVAGASAYAVVGGLRLNTDTTEMLDEDLPFRRNWTRYRDAFPQLENTLTIVVDGSTPHVADGAARRITEELASRPDLFPDLFRPGGDSFFLEHGVLFRELAEIEAMSRSIATMQPIISTLAARPYTPTLLEAITSAGTDASPLDMVQLRVAVDETIAAHLDDRPGACSWPALLGIAPTGDDATRQFIVVQPMLDFDRLFPAEQALLTARAIIGEHAETPDLQVGITGPAALAYDEMRTVTNGALLMTGLALVMVAATLWMALRSLRLIFATLTTLALGLTMTAGFAAVTIGRLNMISVAFAVLYVGLGVDYAIHLCLRYRELLERGHRPLRALRGCVHSIGPTLALCCVSTAIGFLAFVPTAFRGVSELGVIAGGGMFVSLIVSLTVLPALLAVFPLPRVHHVDGHPPPHPSRPLVDGLARRSTLIRWSAAAVAVVSVVLLPGIRFDANPINLQDPDAESVALARSLLTSERVAPWTVAVLCEDEETCAAHQRAFDALPTVRRTVTLGDLVATDQTAKVRVLGNIADQLSNALPAPAETDSIPLTTRMSAWEAFAESVSRNDDPTSVGLHSRARALLADLESRPDDERRRTLDALETRLLGTFLPAIHGLRALATTSSYTEADLPAAVRRRWISGEGLRRLEVTPRGDVSDQNVLRKFVDDVRAVAPDATGDPVVVIEAGDAVIRAFQQAFIGALLAITVLLTILRNARDAFLVLLPLLLAGAMTGAATVLIDVPFNFANVIALPLLLGIGVDNGIHIVQRMHWGSSPPDALLHTSTARAVLFSTLTTTFSFGNLAFSLHRGTASMGIVLTIGIICTLITTLVVLPAFLTKRSRTPPGT